MKSFVQVMIRSPWRGLTFSIYIIIKKDGSFEAVDEEVEYIATQPLQSDVVLSYPYSSLFASRENSSNLISPW